jgi:signal peptide peptidase SppA
MIHTRQCFLNHMGIYCFEPLRLREAVAHVKAGRMPPIRAAAPGRPPGAFELSADGIAVIGIQGPMFKGPSKFSEADSSALRRGVREAAQSADVRGILLAIDSPGGTVAGTDDLATEVRAASKLKPVHAFIEDLGASAAYWVASQAKKITATPTSLIGSIGTLAVVEDSSGLAQMEGVVVHVVSTGAFKGAFVDGAPVLPEHLTDLQEQVDALNMHFLAAVQSGRRLSGDKLSAVSDGRLHIAEAAQSLKLIDSVGSFEDALQTLREDIKFQSSQVSKRRRAAASIALAELGGTK